MLFRLPISSQKFCHSRESGKLPRILLSMMLCLSLMVTSVVCAAETSSVEADAPVLRGTVTASGTLIGAGDTLYIEDATMGLLVKEGRVMSDGSLQLPLVGKLKLGGLSVGEAKRLLAEKYAQYFVQPDVTLQIVSRRPLRIYVNGAVAHPGVYTGGKNTTPEAQQNNRLGSYDVSERSERMYLADALILAGGLNFDANAKDIVIHRQWPQSSTLHVNLVDLMAADDIGQDIPLQDQDVIEVETLPMNALMMDENWEAFARGNLNRGGFRVSVLGAVGKPGALEVKTGDNVLAAIAKAGGFNELADHDRVYILRATQSGQVVKRELNLTDKKLIGRKPIAEWGALLPDDVILVSESPSKKALKRGASVLDRASSAFMFPFFNNLFVK